ncbi:MAG: hypothetical protein E3J70_09805 [Candidatus Heimdallarchaeota archaeon]|nr:MAG: hypothetical protein E3J70_09805 [Candidatus Heimdallarchaeota archaeon]
MGQILLNEKNLLVITPGFPDKNNKNILGIFVKDQVNAIKNEFKEIYVIAPILRTLKFSSRERYCHNYTYDNVSVFYPRCFYVPLIYSFGKKIDNRLRVVLNTIERNNLSFDLVHAHFTWPSGYIGQQIKEKFNTPYILTVHENRKWFQKELDKEYVRSWLRDNGFTGDGVVPDLPDDVIVNASLNVINAYELITAQKFKPAEEYASNERLMENLKKYISE